MVDWTGLGMRVTDTRSSSDKVQVQVQPGIRLLPRQCRSQHDEDIHTIVMAPPYTAEKTTRLSWGRRTFGQSIDNT